MNRNKNILKLGKQLTAPTPEPEKYFDDLIHPCVRYIPEGFAGYKWWMVATPYKSSNSAIENPILYHGVNEGDTPPLEWQATAVVEGTPAGGYNSDGCIYYEGSKLWVFWRENVTPSCLELGLRRGTFGVSTIDGITFSSKKLYAGESSATEDSEMCPIVIKLKDKLQLFGSHYEFSPNRQPRGLSIWDITNNNFDNAPFVKTKNVGQLYYSGFDFWHFDLFSHEDIYYCVASPESGNEILLGKSTDGEYYEFWSTPLLSSSISGASYLYKPTAMILGVCSMYGIQYVHRVEIEYLCLKLSFQM